MQELSTAIAIYRSQKAWLGFIAGTARTF